MLESLTRSLGAVVEHHIVGSICQGRSYESLTHFLGVLLNCLMIVVAVSISVVSVKHQAQKRN